MFLLWHLVNFLQKATQTNVNGKVTSLINHGGTWRLEVQARGGLPTCCAWVCLGPRQALRMDSFLAKWKEKNRKRKPVETSFASGLYANSLKTG